MVLSRWRHQCASILVTVAENTPVTVYRTERVLTYMAASAVGLAVLAIIALLVAGLARIPVNSGIWLTIAILPPIGLTLGVIFAIAFIIVSAIRRSRTARDATK